MSDLIRRKDAIDAVHNEFDEVCVWDESGQTTANEVENILYALPSAEPEIITIEELSNQLGCATIQSALYWFEFLKTLDLLGFAIIKKETK